MALDIFAMDYNFIHERIQGIINQFDEELAFVSPTPDMNHAAWLLGHITWCEDLLIADVPYGKSYRNKEWDPLFEFFSKKRMRNDYPLYAEICNHYNNVHDKISRLFNEVPEESLNELVPYQGGNYSRMSFAIHFIEEGSTHVGQLQYLLKFLKLSNKSV